MCIAKLPSVSLFRFRQPLTILWALLFGLCSPSHLTQSSLPAYINPVYRA